MPVVVLIPSANTTTSDSDDDYSLIILALVLAILNVCVFLMYAGYKFDATFHCWQKIRETCCWGNGCFANCRAMCFQCTTNCCSGNDNANEKDTKDKEKANKNAGTKINKRSHLHVL